MQSGHGDAERLLDRDVNLELIDAAVSSGGEGEEGARLTMVNKFLGPKRFGKMFPNLEPFRPSDEALIELGRAMRDFSPRDTSQDSEIPAGFTYLGQFIDHDLTFDKTTGFPEINDPEQIKQERNPTLGLDSLYGRGPARQPALYDRGFPGSRAMFRIGLTSPNPSPGGSAPGTPEIPGGQPNDLPRRANRKAIIGDERNDENLVVAQTHLAFLKFHNKLVDTLPRGEDEDDSATFTVAEEDRKRIRFHMARRLVRWHYQWIVINDFLRRIIDADVLDDIKTNGRKFYSFDNEPFMPLEFSVAAYRLGHSMVRQTYNYNRIFAHRAVEPNAITPASLELLFTFTSKGVAPIPSNWIIDWRRFFEVDDSNFLNFARSLDAKLIPKLHNLPGIPEEEPNSLAVRNLLRGSRVGLPKAQDVADAMSIRSLRPNQIAGGEDGRVVRQHNFHQETPLWYYILKEAEIQGEGKRLGEMGSRIVGEVFWGVLEGDENSFVSKRPDWRPDGEVPSATPGDFTMADLLKFVDEINPIG